MSKKAKSQWDFGELFPAAETRRVLTVSELTGQIKRLLEQGYGPLWVLGEVSNLRAQSSGHVYFTLKDAGAQLNCVLFRDDAAGWRHLLQDGLKVLVQGGLTVYEPRGQYQLRVRAVEPQGVGALQLAFERLKQKLHAEGLFAPERKRPVPKYPQRVGVVTSPTAAAWQDVLHVVARRNPSLEVVLAPCRVQGQGAAQEIAASIHLLNSWQQSHGNDPRRRLDLILVTRGGGSLEDLWAFNEEAVARAIHESALPVVSAVGHEIDFTISDFVADLRAATPSAAAELITEGAFASWQFVAEAGGRCLQAAHRRCAREQDDLRALARRFALVRPSRRLNDKWQLLDDLQDSLCRRMKARARETRIWWDGLSARWAGLRPSQALARRSERTVELARRICERAHLRQQEKRNRLETLLARLRLLSPAAVLTRGYSITTDAATGEILRDSAQTRRGQSLRTQLAKGVVSSVVTEQADRPPDHLPG